MNFILPYVVLPLGIMICCSTVGPAVGYLLGGSFLNIFVDFDVVDTDG